VRFSITARKWHKWLALIVGVQLLFWTVSGLFMSFVPIERVKSEHVLEKAPQAILKSSDDFLTPQNIVSKFRDKKVLELKLRYLLDIPVYEVVFDSKDSILINAVSGEDLSPISQDLIVKIAQSRIHLPIKSAELIKESLTEVRGRSPVWRVDFDNSEGTTLFIAPETGQLLGLTSTLWRVYDFLWMLHIMDYSERENFNNWWLVLASSLALLVSVSGICLFFYSFRKKDFMFFRKGRPG
jgi:uncharacterized iron-regulated membrane protein